jgi:hypothetical protein
MFVSLQLLVPYHDVLVLEFPHLLNHYAMRLESWLGLEELIHAFERYALGFGNQEKAVEVLVHAYR